MNDIACREFGKTYAQKALEFLLEKAGGSQIELADLMKYYASAISWLTASAFCLVLEKGGPEEAYRLLSLVMAGTSACVRLKGAPFMLTMSAELTPVEEEMGGIQAPPAAPGECSCLRLDNGECATCPEALKVAYLDLSSFILSYLQHSARKTEALDKLCKACGAKYADLVVAELVKEGISKALDQAPEALRQQAIAVALQTVQMFGVQEAPLTVKALQERQA